MLRALRRPRVSVRYIDHVLVDMDLGGASTSGLQAVIEANKEVYRIGKLAGIRFPGWFVVTKVLRKVFQRF
jgi:hypothetical protein